MSTPQICSLSSNYAAKSSWNESNKLKRCVQRDLEQKSVCLEVADGGEGSQLELLHPRSSRRGHGSEAGEGRRGQKGLPWRIPTRNTMVSLPWEWNVCDQLGLAMGVWSLCQSTSRQWSCPTKSPKGCDSYVNAIWSWKRSCLTDCLPPSLLRCLSTSHKEILLHL